MKMISEYGKELQKKYHEAWLDSGVTEYQFEYDIFENPIQKELNEIYKAETFFGDVKGRGVIDSEGNFKVWVAEALHHDVLKKLGLRGSDVYFAYLKKGLVMIDETTMKVQDNRLEKFKKRNPGLKVEIIDSYQYAFI